VTITTAARLTKKPRRAASTLKKMMTVVVLLVALLLLLLTIMRMVVVVVAAAAAEQCPACSCGSGYRQLDDPQKSKTARRTTVALAARPERDSRHFRGAEDGCGDG
jgi:flagellar biosynthesis/type III secretory pathway M-ring protein FliF/YscJ